MEIFNRPGKVKRTKVGSVTFRRRSKRICHNLSSLILAPLLVLPVCASERHILVDLQSEQIMAVSQSPHGSCRSIHADQWPPSDQGSLAKIRKDCGDLRMVSNKGDKIVITLFHVQSGIKLEVVETPRKSRLDSEITALIDHLIPPPGVEGSKKTRLVYFQKYKRSNLQLKVTDTSGTEHKIAYLLGPKEHWFLSADMLLTEADQLKYDQTSGTLVERDIPSSFYLGINFMPFADVLAERYSYKRAVLLKLLFKISEHPLDSAGIGIGYRLPELSLGNKTLGNSILFAAYMLDKEDVLEGGIVKSKEKYTHNWRFGISFGLDKLGPWLK